MEQGFNTDPQAQQHRFDETRRNCDEDYTRPLELLDAVPTAVQRFARELVAARVLAKGMDVALLPREVSTAALLAETSAIAVLPGWNDWAQWVVGLVAHFTSLTGAPAVSLRLSHSRGPTCPRFHIDGVPLRLIATLTGPGTEWLEADDVERLADGSIHQDPDPRLIKHMTPSSIGLFHGRPPNSKSNHGVVHRSPHGCVDRVVMVMDIAN